MAKPRKRKYNKRNKGKIKIRKSVRLVHKNDATRVDKPKVENDYSQAPTKVPSNGVVFKVKIKKK